MLRENKSNPSSASDTMLQLSDWLRQVTYPTFCSFNIERLQDGDVCFCSVLFINKCLRAAKTYIVSLHIVGTSQI